MPFLPPESDVYTEEHACILVYYPDRPEYRRALLGAIADLSNVWNWEADRPTQAEIRAAWLIAEEKTLECANMACLEEMLTRLDAIEDAILATACCDINEPVQIGDGPVVWPTEGPADLPPAGGDWATDPYPVTPATDPGDTGTVTQSDWEQYVCGAADLIVDSMIQWFHFTAFALRLGYGAIRVADYFVKIIASKALPGVLDDWAVWELPTMTELFLDIYQELTPGILYDAAEDLDNLRDAFACALTGVNTAEFALTVIETLIRGNVRNGTMIAGMASGAIFAPIALVWNGAFNADFESGCTCEGGEIITPFGMRINMLDATGTGSFGGWKPRFRSTSAWLTADWTNYHVQDGDWEDGVMQNAPALAHESWPADHEHTVNLDPSPTGMSSVIRIFDNVGDISMTLEIQAVWDGSSWRPVIGFDGLSINNGLSVTSTGNRIILPTQTVPGSTDITFTPLVL